MQGWRILWQAMALACASGMALANEPAPVRQAELVRLVRQDCGACHGWTLKGGLGPPLVAAALGARPAESLKYTILYGRRGTPMPAWRPFLTEAEVDWIVARLIEGFPDAR
jgi:cytochrome c55X